MASLFHNYSKPGKGVNKNEKQKKGIALFQELFTRKFWSYLLLNVIYFISALPGMILVWIPIYGSLIDLSGASTSEHFSAMAGFAAVISLFLSVIFSLSPLSSGYYYILRRYTDEEHAWVIGDFFGKFKENWKKSLIIYIIDIVLIWICVFSLRLYWILMATQAYIVALITIFVIALVIYAVMVPYKWIQLVTVDLKLKDIYKNALFMVLGVLRVTFTYIVMSAFYGLLLYYLFVSAPLYGILFMILLGFAVYGLMQAIATYPTVKKHIVEPAKKEYYSED
ncbi:MAG: DUF624 domain-containing protein [Clostridia bacterium]|nr:DUF624 domain-containing protein [Clostridia bacterium]